MSKQLAIMTAPEFGMRDMSVPGFWFSVTFGENLTSGALIVLSVDRMVKEVIAADIQNIKSLEGAPCQVDVSDDNIVSFVKVLNK